MTVLLHVHSPANSSVNTCDLAPFFSTSRVLHAQSCAGLSMCDVSFGFPVPRAEFLLLVSRHMPMGEYPREHAMQICL